MAGSRTPPSLARKLTRFPLVGAFNTLVYAVATYVCIAKLGMGSRLATVAGYCTALPLAYLAHRRYTFDSQGAVATEMPRFIVVHLVGMAVTWLSMDVVQRLGGRYGAGILLGAVLVPVLSFLLQDRWVFGANRGSAASTASAADRSAH